MKTTRLLTAALAALCLGLLTQAGMSPAAAGGAKMTFDQTVYDFGTIKKGADGRGEFTFTNTGSAPVIIGRAASSCGCLVPTAPKEPIAPGQIGVIGFEYDTKRMGAFNKTITLLSNAQPPRMALKVKGKVQ